MGIPFLPTRYVQKSTKVDNRYAKEKGPYLLGEQLSIAGLKLLTFVIGLNSGAQIEHVPARCLDKYSHVMAALKAAADHRKVKKWNSKHEYRSTWGLSAPIIVV